MLLIPIHTRVHFLKQRLNYNSVSNIYKRETPALKSGGKDIRSEGGL